MSEVVELDTEAELVRRKRAKLSLAEFARSIDIPGRPYSNDEDEWMFHPIETGIALHHQVLMKLLDRVHNREIKQLMVFMPPGSGKSAYTSVVYPAYAMAKRKGSRFILGSYASAIAWKQSRRTRQIVRSAKYLPIFGTGLVAGNQSVEEWALTNGSEYMAAGLLSGVTGNRATDLLIDDPVAGRDEADSATIRKRTRESYEDDLSTRLMPGGSTTIIQTRWHQDDLSGGILPVDWKGESGFIRGRDGLDWFVLCVPAIADRIDDPLGRKPGERLWPEWFTVEHFERFKANQRTWNALFQQKPTADEGTFFKLEWFEDRYERLPKNLRKFGWSDYAVTPDGGDYTEHGVFGLDDQDGLWVLDWWFGQTSSDVWVEKQCDLIYKHKPLMWACERGVIWRSIKPYLTQRMAQRRLHETRIEDLPTTGDKVAMARGAQGMASMGQIRFPMRSSFHERVISQLVAFPAGTFDDAVDTLGGAVRAIPLVGHPPKRTQIAASAVVDYGIDNELGM